MGAAGRARPRSRQLSRPANRVRRFIETGVYRIGGQSGLRTDLLAESTRPTWQRDRHRERARPAVGERALDRQLYLQNRAGRHDRRAWLGLSALVHHSIAECAHCPARTWWKVFRCALSAIGPWPIAI